MAGDELTQNQTSCSEILRKGPILLKRTQEPVWRLNCSKVPLLLYEVALWVSAGCYDVLYGIVLGVYVGYKQMFKSLPCLSNSRGFRVSGKP